MVLDRTGHVAHKALYHRVGIFGRTALLLRERPLSYDNNQADNKNETTGFEPFHCFSPFRNFNSFLKDTRCVGMDSSSKLELWMKQISWPNSARNSVTRCAPQSLSASWMAARGP